MKKQDTLENQVNIVYLALGSNLGFKVMNIEKAKLFLLSNNIDALKLRYLKEPSIGSRNPGWCGG